MPPKLKIQKTRSKKVEPRNIDIDFLRQSLHAYQQKFVNAESPFSLTDLIEIKLFLETQKEAILNFLLRNPKWSYLSLTKRTKYVYDLLNLTTILLNFHDFIIKKIANSSIQSEIDITLKELITKLRPIAEIIEVNALIVSYLKQNDFVNLRLALGKQAVLPLFGTSVHGLRGGFLNFYSVIDRFNFQCRIQNEIGKAPRVFRDYVNNPTKNMAYFYQKKYQHLPDDLINLYVATTTDDIITFKKLFLPIHFTAATQQRDGYLYTLLAWAFEKKCSKIIAFLLEQAGKILPRSFNSDIVTYFYFVCALGDFNQFRDIVLKTLNLWKKYMSDQEQGYEYLLKPIIQCDRSDLFPSLLAIAHSNLGFFNLILLYEAKKIIRYIYSFACRAGGISGLDYADIIMFTQKMIKNAYIDGLIIFLEQKSQLTPQRKPIFELMKSILKNEKLKIQEYLQLDIDLKFKLADAELLNSGICCLIVGNLPLFQLFESRATKPIRTQIEQHPSEHNSFFSDITSINLKKLTPNVKDYVHCKNRAELLNLFLIKALESLVINKNLNRDEIMLLANPEINLINFKNAIQIYTTTMLEGITTENPSIHSLFDAFDVFLSVLQKIISRNDIEKFNLLAEMLLKFCISTQKIIHPHADYIKEKLFQIIFETKLIVYIKQTVTLILSLHSDFLIEIFLKVLATYRQLIINDPYLFKYFIHNIPNSRATLLSKYYEPLSLFAASSVVDPALWSLREFFLMENFEQIDSDLHLNKKNENLANNITLLIVKLCDSSLINELLDITENLVKFFNQDLQCIFDIVSKSKNNNAKNLFTILFGIYQSEDLQQALTLVFEQPHISEYIKYRSGEFLYRNLPSLFHHNESIELLFKINQLKEQPFSEEKFISQLKDFFTEKCQSLAQEKESTKYLLYRILIIALNMKLNMFNQTKILQTPAPSATDSMSFI